MSIVTFWGSGKEQVGKTLATVAIATNMAIEHNKKILVISASYKNETIKNCYWREQEEVKRASVFKQPSKVEIASGIEGLAKIITSNKVTPTVITDYTKIVFKDRLEILLGFDYDALVDEEEISRKEGKLTKEEISKIYSDIVQLANKYYDVVLVDLDNEINLLGANQIFDKSDMVIAMASQKTSSIKEMQQKRNELPTNKSMIVIGKYDSNSKYTLKNLTRTLGEKKELLCIPYNTLYFEAAQEGNVADLFLRLRRLDDKKEENIFFIEQVKKVTEEIIKKIDENKLMTRGGR